ncbi:MAG: hypothetical protein ER33_06700 [Cyanobium sp. CACIAM 14]|nr:MAG: hypothetical protein ER33_06700 [Cyanobium sp. CACIAM 14]
MSTTLLDPNGNIQLVLDSGTGLVSVVPAAGGTSVAVRFQGIQITASQFAGWQILAAETIAAGQNRVLWKELATGRLHTWTVDGSWNYVQSNGIFDPSSPEGLQLQQQFSVDATGAPVTGQPPTTGTSTLQVLDPNGSVRLLRDPATDLVSIQSDGVSLPLRFQGSQVRASQFAGWQILAAETIAAGQNRVLWKELATGRLHTWTVDGSWNYVQSNGIFDPSSPEGLQLQQQFSVDATGAPVTGQPPPPASTAIKIGTQTFPTIRSAIQGAAANSLIELGTGTYNITKSDTDASSPATSGASPATLTGFALSGVTIRGAGSEATVILGNPRLHTLQADGPPPVGFRLEGVKLNYDAAAEGYLLAPSRGSLPYDPSSPTMAGLSIVDVAFTGQHRGAVGVSGTYMDISGSKDILLDRIVVKLEGQYGYSPATGEGGGFFLFMEGGRNLQARNSSFFEAGYSSSLIALFTPDVIMDSNQFVGSGLIKQDDGSDLEDNPRGERFYNAGGTFTNNRLSGGAFFDYLYVLADQGVVWRDYLAKEGPIPPLKTSVVGNVFDILNGGYGMLIRSDLPVQQLQGLLDVHGNAFNGGVAVKSELPSPGGLVFGPNTVNGVAFDRLRVGGVQSDDINAAGDAGTSNWISGDLGNDTLTGGTQADAFVFATPLDGVANVDRITNFSVAQGDRIWLDDAIFTSLSANGLSGLTQVANGADLELRYFSPATGTSTTFATLSGLAGTTLTAASFVIF